MRVIALAISMASLIVVAHPIAPNVVDGQGGGSTAAVVYEGARLISGDGSAAIEDGAFVVQNGRFTAVGARRSVTAPAGAARVSLTGNTVMPAMINVHVHIGFEGYTSWGASFSIICSARLFTAPPSLSRSARSPLMPRCSFNAISKPGSSRPRRGFSSCRAWRRPTAGRTRRCAWRRRRFAS
jgi:hypothetical protein